MLDKFRLTDRVAIVTGPGSGIGKAIALAFDAARYITGQTIAVDGGRRGYGDS